MRRGDGRVKENTEKGEIEGKKGETEKGKVGSKGTRRGEWVPRDGKEKVTRVQGEEEVVGQGR